MCQRIGWTWRFVQPARVLSSSAQVWGALSRHGMGEGLEVPQKLGFIYMLNGDNGTSNTDPFATEETRDNNWIKTGRKWDRDPALLSAMGTSWLGPSRRHSLCRLQSLAWSGTPPDLRGGGPDPDARTRER